MNKSLVLYYSYEGNTKTVANFIRDRLGCDIESIKPVNEMESKGFGKYFWGGAKVVMHRKPNLITIQSDVPSYDTLLIGTPVWAWTITPPILTLISSDLIRDKQIYFFYTHDGGPGQIEHKFAKLLHPSNVVKSSKGFKCVKNHIEETKSAVDLWLSSIND